MDKESEGIKNFAVGFFNNLKCSLAWQDEMLMVDNVPKDFETFAGKKGPYKFLFSSNPSCVVDDSIEIMSKGNFLLRQMTDYLENMGQTTLIKLNFNADSELVKKHLKFKNCDVLGLKEKHENKIIFRFTFQTTLQYLNDKEQILNSIFVKDNQIVDFDLKNYSALEGRKQDVVLGDIKPYYNLAKENLKLCIKEKLEKTGEVLKIKMEKEIERIKGHYDHQITEVDLEINKCNEQLKDLEEGNTNGDVKNIPARINKIKERIEELKKAGQKEKLEKEREFFINDEIHKHSLNIGNKLINTTIIYYPDFSFDLTIKNSGGMRTLDLKYDALTNNLSIPVCETCNAGINEVNLCSLGHITCSNCLTHCSGCGNDVCKTCLSKRCCVCGRSFCKKCIVKCLKCGNYVCKDHSKKIGGRDICTSCLKRCYSCGNFEDRTIKCPSCNAEYCEKCARTKIVGRVCVSCGKKCGFCGNYVSNKDFERCVGCKIDCGFLAKCKNCRRQLCHKLKR